MRHDDRRHRPSRTNKAFRLYHAGPAFTVVLLLVTVFSGSAAALDINSSQSLQYYGDDDLDFEVGADGVITASNNLSMGTATNNITDFFDTTACATDRFVTRLYANGSYQCTDASSIDTTVADDQNLSEVLTQGNVANQTIEFSGGVTIGTTQDNELAEYQSNVLIGKNVYDGGHDHVVAIGPSATGDSDNALAIGYDASANGISAVAIGDDASTQYGQSVAIGNIADASGGVDTIAIGDSPDASQDYAIAIGRRASASATGAVAIGRYANAPNQYEVTFGHLGNQYRGGPLDVNVTGNLTVHGSGGLDVLNGSVNMNGNNLALNGGYLSNDGGNEGLQIDNSGNVEIPNGKLGVGTSPNSRLDLDAGSVSDYDTLAQFSYSDDSGDEQPLEVMAANTSENAFEDMFALRYYLRGSKDGTYSGVNFHRGGSYRGEYLSFDTNGTQAMQIDPSQNVEVPNGNLLASGSSSAGETALSIESSDGESLDFIETSSGSQNNIALQNPDGATVFRWPDAVSTTWVTTDLEMRSNSKIRTGRNSGSETGFYDSQNSQNILLAKEGGNVEIPNGNLDMQGNNLIDVDTVGGNQYSSLIWKNTFESGQFNDWQTGGTASLTTASGYSGSNSGLFRNGTVSNDAITTDAYVKLPSYVTGNFYGQTIQVVVKAKQASTDPASEFGIVYDSDHCGNSGLNKFNPTSNWETYTFSWNHCSASGTSRDRIGIVGDTSGSNNGTQIDDIYVRKIEREGGMNLNGQLDMGSNKIINLQNPSSAQDAATSPTWIIMMTRGFQAS